MKLLPPASFVGPVTRQGRTLKLPGSDLCFFFKYKWKLICNLFVPDVFWVLWNPKVSTRGLVVFDKESIRISSDLIRTKMCSSSHSVAGRPLHPQEVSKWSVSIEDQTWCYHGQFSVTGPSKQCFMEMKWNDLGGCFPVSFWEGSLYQDFTWTTIASWWYRLNSGPLEISCCSSLSGMPVRRAK